MNDFFKRILMQIVLPCGAWWSYFYLPALFQAWVYFAYAQQAVLLTLMGIVYLLKYARKETLSKNKGV